MTAKNKVIVRIMGQEYTLVSEDSREYMQKVSNLVDDKMREITAANKRLSTSMIAVLTALNTMDEHLKLQEQLQQIKMRQADPSIEVAELRKELTGAYKALEERRQECDQLSQEFEKMIKNSKDYEQGLTGMRQKIDELLKKVAERESEVVALKAEKMEIAERLALKERELQEFIETFDIK